MNLIKCFIFILWIILSKLSFAIDYEFYENILTLNGFLTASAGKIIAGNKYDRYIEKYNCPCFPANYEYGSMYDNNGWKFKPESLLGVQATVSTKNKNFSATLQLVTRGINDFVTDIDWAYLTYRINEQLSIQAGHKRLPLYYYTDFMYIGFSYPWVRPPVDLYGWQIYSYNGVNLLYKDIWGSWSAIANFWTGRQSDRNNKMWSDIYGSDKDETWRNIVGAYLDLNKNDFYNIRLIHMQNYVDRFTFNNDNSVTHYPNNMRQLFYGVAANIDADHWLLRSEFTYFKRPANHNDYISLLFGLGLKYNHLTALSTYSKFNERSEEWPNEVERHDTRTLLFRWDVTGSLALKLQYDIFHDRSAPGFPFVGNSKLLSTAIVMAF